MEWKEKELQILEAMRTLMRKGYDLNNLKIEQIAQTAGIGKGTVYLYFPSKEVLIEQGILYVMRREAEEVGQCSQDGCFMEAFTAVLRCLHRFLAEEAPAVQRIFHTLQQPMLPTSCMPRDMLGEEGCRRMQEALETLHQKGVQENIFPPCSNPCYLQMAFVGAVAGFFNTLSGWPEISAKQAEKMAVQLFIRALSEKI